MSERTDLEFNVRFLPFQLNEDAPQQSSKLEMYMNKFGMSKEQCMYKSEAMRQRFDAVGLPFRFTETDLTGNTFDAHRVITAAYSKGGAAAQNIVCEQIFKSYFAEGRAPSDPDFLWAAADSVGLDGVALVTDPSYGAAETEEAMEIGRSHGVTGVPHFIISMEGSEGSQELHGAHPPENFAAVLEYLSRS